MIKAVIFDMDGLLIDSEPLWQEAEINIFKKAGVNLTREMCRQTTGLGIDEAIKHWYDVNPWENYPLEQLRIEIITEVNRLISEKGEAMPGMEYILDFFDKKNMPLALASSSSFDLIETVVTKLQIKNRFRIIHSAQREEYSKPHPAIFISTAKMLQVEPKECLVFEDSFNGLIAAKAARMKAIAVPETALFNDNRMGIADEKLPSLLHFNQNVFERIK